MQLKPVPPDPQSEIMLYDPALHHTHPYPNTAAEYRAYHGMIAWLFNPWTGARRDPRDIGSDVFGRLIVPSRPVGAKEQ
jgi:hypothetical protein